MKVILCGACGNMGRVLNSLVDEREGIDIVARVDKVYTDKKDNCFCNILDVDVKADVIIDFSHHSATYDILDYAINSHTPLVIAATGQTSQEVDKIKMASSKIPIFFAHNMSRGIAFACSIVKTLAREYPYADIEIVEIHHNEKKDSPSGTAIMLKNTIDDVLQSAKHIPIHSLRLGMDVGKHEVIFDTGCERITISHQAYSRNIYAEGVIQVLYYIIDKKNGLYCMNDIIKIGT